MTVVSDPPVGEPAVVTIERQAIASPIGWSSILAGAAVAVGSWLVLHLLGIGIGLVAIDPDNASSLRGIGIGAGVWSLIAPVIALFIGGLVVGRVAPTINSVTAAIHGAVAWAITAIAFVVMITMLVGSMMRGVARAGDLATNVAGSAIGAAAGGVGPASSALGLSAEDLVGPLNERLAAQGMPPVEASQLSAAVREIAATSVRTGSVDRATIVGILSERTDLSQQQVEVLAGQLEDKLREAGAGAQDMMREAGGHALSAAEATGKVVLALSLAMLVGLGAAMLGALLSVRHERREHVVLPRATTTTRPPRTTVTPPERTTTVTPPERTTTVTSPEPPE